METSFRKSKRGNTKPFATGGDQLDQRDQLSVNTKQLAFEKFC